MNSRTPGHETQLVSMRVWRKTLADLKVLAALQERSMLSVLDELVTNALKEERKKRGWIDKTSST